MGLVVVAAVELLLPRIPARLISGEKCSNNKGLFFRKRGENALGCEVFGSARQTWIMECFEKQPRDLECPVLVRDTPQNKVVDKELYSLRGALGFPDSDPKESSPALSCMPGPS